VVWIDLSTDGAHELLELLRGRLFSLCLSLSLLIGLCGLVHGPEEADNTDVEGDSADDPVLESLAKHLKGNLTVKNHNGKKINLEIAAFLKNKNQS
jgi:hypothetical protein